MCKPAIGMLACATLLQGTCWLMQWLMQWLIQGIPPLFLDQTEDRRCAPPYLRVLMTAPPPYLKVWIGHWADVYWALSVDIGCYLKGISTDMHTIRY